MAFFGDDLNRMALLAPLEEPEKAIYLESPVYGFYQRYIDGSEEHFGIAISEATGVTLGKSTKQAMACELIEKALAGDSARTGWARFLLTETDDEINSLL